MGLIYQDLSSFKQQNSQYRSSEAHLNSKTVSDKAPQLL